MSKRFPILYARASTGRVKVWEIIADGDTMVIRNGLQEGAMKEQTKTIVGKNIGKANETTPEQQCELECQSKWQKKIDEQYTEDITTVRDYASQEIILPMLAHNFKKRKHDIKYPCYVQPKLNGVRCIFQDGKFISRKGKVYDTMEHLRPELEKLNINMPDGEIYVHGMKFEHILRLVKKFRSAEENGKLEYWIYDEVADYSFRDRYQELIEHFDQDIKGTSVTIKLVPTEIVNSEEEIKSHHDQWISEGFEGIIIRNSEGAYEGGLHRSQNLQKLKNFEEDEFKIIGGFPAKGSEEGAVVFECKTKEGKTFKVRPRGSMEMRRQWMRDINNIIGKDLTVRYLEISSFGLPTGNTVGVCLRDYE